MKYLFLILFAGCGHARADDDAAAGRSVLEIDHDIYGDECVFEGAFFLPDGTPILGNPDCCPNGTEMVGIHQNAVVCW